MYVLYRIKRGKCVSCIELREENACLIKSREENACHVQNIERKMRLLYRIKRRKIVYACVSSEITKDFSK